MSAKQPVYRYKNQLLTFETPLIMGILNVTPDSFFDGGRFNNKIQAVNQINKMVNEGVDIIDIGGMSSRPGAEIINAQQEIDRVCPAIEYITTKHPNTLISIDTIHAQTAKIALNNGAGIVNDISAGNINPEIIEIAAQFQVPYILMHMQGQPNNMQNKPNYKNVVEEVADFFIQKIALLKSKGINDIIIDPGFGFGKSITHNYQLLKNLGSFKILNLPVLAGLSRKSMIYKPLQINPNEALNGTTALNMMALQNGANILRVHDIKQATQAVKLYELYNNN